MKPLTELDLLWHKDPLKLEDAATLLFGKSGSSTTEGVLAAAIEAGKLRANVVRWTVYNGNMGCDIDDGSGNINQHETTIRMVDFKAYCQTIGVVIVDGTLQTMQPDFDKTSQTYPEELDFALQAWRAVSATEEKGKPKVRIRSWLNDANAKLSKEKKLSKEAIERIAIVANWDKTGGATRSD